jgi:hypothetical protein
MRTNGAVPSRWWDRCCRWYFQKIGLPAEEAHLLWEPVKPQFIEALQEESHQLHRQLYAWRLDHQREIDTLSQLALAGLAAGDRLAAAQNQPSLFDEPPS